jgi:hypothetical protein
MLMTRMRMKQLEGSGIRCSSAMTPVILLSFRTTENSGTNAPGGLAWARNGRRNDVMSQPSAS